MNRATPLLSLSPRPDARWRQCGARAPREPTSLCPAISSLSRSLSSHPSSEAYITPLYRFESTIQSLLRPPSHSLPSHPPSGADLAPLHRSSKPPTETKAFESIVCYVVCFSSTRGWISDAPSSSLLILPQSFPKISTASKTINTDTFASTSAISFTLSWSLQ